MAEVTARPGLIEHGAPERPFYDPTLSYQENYDLGPFGLFAGSPATLPTKTPTHVAFLGADLGLPFGIPAGPLLNSRYVAAAFRWGYNLVHYKTVRSRFWPSHSYPNMLQVEVPARLEQSGADMQLEAEPFGLAGIVRPEEIAHLSITNSFGMPAQQPALWQHDVAQAAQAAGPGQVLAVSVVGTVDQGGTAADFALDFALAAVMARKAGAMVVEANLSCPNVGGHGLLCHDIAGSAEVCARIKEALPNTPLLVKLGNYGADAAGTAALEGLVAALEPYVAGFAAINAVPYTVLDHAGNQALPGVARLRAGICGAAIRGLGLSMVERLALIRKQNGSSWGIIGVGGVMTPDDYFAYRAAGADVVQGATGPMWRPQLALEIAAQERSDSRD